ncbi:hypothetical protein QL285_094411 [Trifolium repens]|nr:hypothetical protein QL285_094411 [Trifolium repens]
MLLVLLVWFKFGVVFCFVELSSLLLSQLVLFLWRINVLLPFVLHWSCVDRVVEARDELHRMLNETIKESFGGFGLKKSGKKYKGSLLMLVTSQDIS